MQASLRKERVRSDRLAEDLNRLRMQVQQSVAPIKYDSTPVDDLLQELQVPLQLFKERAGNRVSCRFLYNKAACEQHQFAQA